MERGFKKVEALLEQEPGGDIATLLKQVGMTLISSVGGASGPLYGTFFMKASAALSEAEAAGMHSLETSDLASLFNAGVRGVMDRGRAGPGDKTMLDALLPAAHALTESAAGGLDVREALHIASQKAREGMEATAPLVARKGRASYLGERSRGHQDPGATSSYFIIHALYEVIASIPADTQEG
jgi:dihydroxyacetone kinase-like protein